MADPTGFLKYTHRELPKRRPVPLRLRDWNEVYEEFDDETLRAPGNPLHGLRYSVLPQRMSAGQSDPGMERPGAHGAVGATRSNGCTPPTTSPTSPAGCARHRASRRVCWESTRIR